MLRLEQDCTRLDAGEGVHSFELKEVGVSHSSRVLPAVFLASKSYKVTTIHTQYVCLEKSRNQLNRQRVATTVVVAAFITNVTSLCSFLTIASFPYQQTQLDYQTLHSLQPNELTALPVLPALSAAHHLIEPAFLPQIFTSSLLTCSNTRLIQACTLSHM